MYLSHYKLSAMPFQINTDPRFLYLSSDHKEALANLKYGLQAGDGYVVLIGAVGTGKTTLVNALVETLDESVCFAVINHPRMEPMEFLSFVVRSFDPTNRLSTKADCLLFLKQFLEKSYKQNKRVLLIIDEAHRLSDELLEETRLLSNMEQSGTKLLQIFFVGQTELKPRLLSSSNLALRQRITLYYHLQPLNEENTVHYIRHRLNVAGCESQPFTARSIHAIYRHTSGYPRRINRLCDRALLTGFAKGRQIIDDDIIYECAREINLIDPLQPVFRPVHRTHQALWRWWESERMHHVRSNAKSACIHALKKAGKLTSELTKRLGRAIVQGSARFRNKFVSIEKKLPKRRWGMNAAALAALVVVGWAIGNYWRSDEQVGIVTAEAPATVTKGTHAPTTPDTEETHIMAAYVPRPPDAANSEKSFSSGQSPAPVAQKRSSEDQAVNAFFEAEKYQEVIALLQNGNGEAPERADQRALYVSALIARAGQLKTQSPGRSAALLNQAVAADPDNTDALVQLGNLLTRTGDYQRAVAVYAKALQHDGKLPDALYNLGFIYANTGDYQKAEQALERVVALKPAYVDKALFNLAVIQQTIGKQQACLASLEAAVAIRPGNAKAQAYLREIRQGQEATR